MREVAYAAQDLHGKVFTVRNPIVVCEVRKKPLLSLAMLEDKGFYMSVENGGRILGMCLRRQGNSYHVGVEFEDGLLERKWKGGREISHPPGLKAPINSDVAGFSVAAGMSEKRKVYMAGNSVTDGANERKAVAKSTLEMTSRETVKSHQLARIPFVPWKRVCCGKRP